MIVFNKPSITGLERKYISDALSLDKLCGDGTYTKKVYELFKNKLGVRNLLLTTSCSHALDMTAILADIKPGDEVIAPSYTFVSTVNAFVLRGAVPVFCDVEPSTMNINADKIEELITPKTKAIYAVHYAGVVCDMDKINEIAKRHGLIVVEDAAQALGSVYKGRYPAGTIGDMGTYSFHETKNYVMGEGGALIVKSPELLEKAEIIREKGTDRSRFWRGQVDKYTWQMTGSSYLPSDVLAAMLAAQLERYDEIMSKRMSIWNRYYEAFAEDEAAGRIVRPFIPDYSSHNAHMFYMFLPSLEKRSAVIEGLKEKGVQAVFHYIPLHAAPNGIRVTGGRKFDLPVTEEYADRLMRLPLWADMTDSEVDQVIESVKDLIK